VHTRQCACLARGPHPMQRLHCRSVGFSLPASCSLVGTSEASLLSQAFLCCTLRCGRELAADMV